MCVVTNYAQAVYVPWLVCMDTNSDTTDACNTQVGVVGSVIETCLSDNIDSLIATYLAIDSPISGTPTVTVDGTTTRNSYYFICKALCKADPSLTACADTNGQCRNSAANGFDPDMEVEMELVPRSVAV